MNTPMPDAPQNAMMPQGPPEAPPGPAQPAGNMMMAQPQQAAPAPAPQPSPEEIAQSRKHVAAIMDGLMHLTAKPKGDLTKQDVFKAAADMIAKGAFPTPEARQDLVVTMAGLPDDEPALRKALGGFLLAVSTGRQQLHSVFGEGE